MSGAFHWVRVRLFCYATENEEKLVEVMKALTGDIEFEIEESEGLHGNSMTVFSADITKKRDAEKIFSNLGPELIAEIRGQLEERIDDDCVFYLRLDKQMAVVGSYKVAHHGDVLSLTAKVVAHPARKEVAVKKMDDFLQSL